MSPATLTKKIDLLEAQADSMKKTAQAVRRIMSVHFHAPAPRKGGKGLSDQERAKVIATRRANKRRK